MGQNKAMSPKTVPYSLPFRNYPERNGCRKSLLSDWVHPRWAHRSATTPVATYLSLPRNLCGHGGGEPEHNYTDWAQFSPAHSHVQFPHQFILYWPLFILKISPGCSLERLMLKLKLQYFGHLILGWVIILLKIYKHAFLQINYLCFTRDLGPLHPSSHRLQSPGPGLQTPWHPPTFILSQHQGLFKWVSSSHQVTFSLQNKDVKFALRKILDSRKHSWIESVSWCHTNHLQWVRFIIQMFTVLVTLLHITSPTFSSWTLLQKYIIMIMYG